MQALQRTEAGVQKNPAMVGGLQEQNNSTVIVGGLPVNYVALALQTDVSFRPVWNVSSNYLTGFIARHTHEDGKDNTALADAMARADLGLLARSVAELTAALQQGRRMVLIVPAFFETLTRQPGRDHYFDFMRNVPAPVRSLIVLQIRETPVLANKESIQTVQQRYAGLVRSLIVTSDLYGQNVDTGWRRDVRTCAITLENDPEEEHSNIGLMESFSGKMQAFGRTAMVDGIFSKSMLIAAKGLGFTYISGPAVQGDEKGLAAIRPFSLQNAYHC